MKQQANYFSKNTKMLMVFMIGDSGLLILLDENTWQPVDSILINLNGYKVEYSGYELAVPQNGSKLSDKPDFVFLSGK